LFEGCGVLPSGIMTSHITSTPLVRAASGKTRTGLSTQSELEPSACMVELPSEAPQRKAASSEGKLFEFLQLRLATQIWQPACTRRAICIRAYIFVMAVSHKLMTRSVRKSVVCTAVVCTAANGAWRQPMKP